MESREPPFETVHLRRPVVWRWFVPFFIIFSLLAAGSSAGSEEYKDLYGLGFPRTLHRLIDRNEKGSGVYVLEKGEEALLARAWMVGNAVERIDVLTFIWSLDHIGLLATDALVKAADRGAHVRVVVDDMLLDDQPLDILLALTAHPRIDIRVYNPIMSVGVNRLELVGNLLTDFRRFNSRMHNKTFLADRMIGVCGGRNVANEYFDYNQEYNFRDRDILVVGAVVQEMHRNFEAYWNSELSVPLETLLPKRMVDLRPAEVARIYQELDECGQRLIDSLPLVRRAFVEKDKRLADMLDAITWSSKVRFVSDRPGKNLGKPGLGGGGEMVDALAEAIASAQKSITIQSPYLVLPVGGIELLEKSRQGIDVRISTNSLASTDNIAAFSGYQDIRDDLLDAGIEIREFRPNPAIERELIERYLGPKGTGPIFVLHAKTVVIDGELLYIGTFNLDPRSANLNTEEGIFVRDRELAREVESQIHLEMQPENSWNPATENPNRHAGPWRNFRRWFFGLFPIQPLL